MSRILLPAASAATLVMTAAAGTAAPPIPIPATPAIAREGDPTSRIDEQVRATVLPGSEPAPVAPHTATTMPAHGDISLNLPAADAATVARTVLGDILHRNYTIAQGVNGTVSLVTPYPVAKSALLRLLEDALRNAGLALTPVAGGFEIVPAASASGLVAPDATGFGTEIVTVRFINAEEVRKVLDSVLPGVVRSTDAVTGAVTIAGTTGQRASARDLLRQFDVDWLRGTSFALFMPRRTDARLIVPALDKLINAPDSPTHGLVRLITMDTIDGILAISTQPQYLLDVKRWVEILDREGESNERRIFVYRVQNGRARDLTRTINAAYGAGTDSGGSTNPDPFADRNAAPGNASGPGQIPPARAPTPARPANAGTIAGGDGKAEGMPVRITADEGNNAVIVFGTAREYAVVEDALRKLDVPPQQILIEAAITEVGLTDTLSYGVQWIYSNNGSSFGFSEGTNPTNPAQPGQGFPGFSYAYTGTSIAATLNAMQKRSNLKVVSAPKLLVLNNQTAALQVGDEVPISTGTTTNLSNTNAVTSTIDYKDTGVILKITPRVNASGLVQLDVSQEVSQISTEAPTAATQQQSPTISTRRIATTVAVHDGQVIALGGLFSNAKTITKRGIPLLSQIPVIGGAFGSRSVNDTRTELIVLLKPHVLTTAEDARAATDELRGKLRTLEPFRSSGRIP